MICLAKSQQGLSTMAEVVLHAESGVSLGMRGVDLSAPMHGLAIQAKSQGDE